MQTESIVLPILSHPNFHADAPIATSFGDIDLGENVIGPWRVRTRQQRHSDPSIAIRVGENLTYCTDTPYDRENARFAQGSDLLLHEAWLVGGSECDPFHTAAGDAGLVAQEAGVGRLVLVHIDPRIGDAQQLVTAARRHFPMTEVGRDMMRVSVR